MNKKIQYYKYFLIILLSVLFLFTAITHAATLILSPSSQNISIDQTLTVDINLDTQSVAIDGVDIFSLRYNPAILEVQDSNTSMSGVQISPGTLLSNTLTNTVNTLNGTIQFSQVTTGGSTYTGNGKLATVIFKGKAAGNSPVAFDFVLGRTSDTNVAGGGQDKLTSVTNGSYTVTTGTTIPTPTLTPTLTPTSTPAPGLPKGFFDGISGSTIFGWTYDPDSSSTSNNTQIFIDDDLIYSGITNTLRPDVNLAFDIQGYHGFAFEIPSKYRDNKSHKVYIYGMDINEATKWTYLTNSPKSFILSQTTILLTPTPSVSSGPAPTASPTPTVIPTPIITITPTPTPSTTPALTSINMTNNTFSPTTTTITAGTTVKWINGSLINHTVTSDNGLFNSGALIPNDTYEYRFNTPGTHRYYCAFHGGPNGVGMSGTVIVQATPTPTPTPTSTPVLCSAVYSPVCGVDGKTYANSCVATEQKKIDILYYGACVLPSVTPTPVSTSSPQATPTPSTGSGSSTYALSHLRGRVIRSIDSPKVYYVTQKGLKRWIPNESIFLAYGNKWSDIIIVSQAQINAISDNILIRATGDTKVYKLNNINRSKHWIISAEVFNRDNYKWDEIAPVNQMELDWYLTGESVY